MLTLSQEEQLRIQTLKNQGKTPREIAGYIGGNRLQAPSTIQLQRNEQPQQGNVLGRTIMDMPQDILSGFKGAGEDLVQRGQNIRESFAAGQRGEQGPIQTGFQTAGNVLGGAFDVAFQGVKTAASLPLTQEAETAIGEGIATGVQTVDEKTGISEWYGSLPPNQQRNIVAALGFGEAATVGGASLFSKPLSKMFKPRPTTPEITPGVDKTVPKLQQIAEEAVDGNIAPAMRVAEATGEAATVRKFQTDLAKAYQSAFVENRMSINRRLDDIAERSDMSRDQLLEAIAREGYVPEIEGQLGRFGGAIEDISKRQTEIMRSLDEVLEQSKATVSVDDFHQLARRAVLDDTRIIIGKQQALNAVDNVFNDLRQSFPSGQLSARQVKEINVDTNRVTKAFKDDKFASDGVYLIGKTARDWMEKNIPDSSVRTANLEWARLNTMRRAMDEVLDSQRVDVGLIGRTIGSYVGVLSGAATGAILAGPGGLITAGLLSKVGADFLANAIRRRIFNPETAQKVREVVQSNNRLAEKLRSTAKTQEGKNFIDELAGFRVGEQPQLPPARPGAPRSEVGSGAPIATGGQTPAGRVTTGVTERAREGAVRQPAQTGQLRQQAERFKSVESFVKAVKNNPAWLKKFEEAGVTPEQIGKMVIGGGTALGLVYLLDNEELSGTGFMIMGSILGGMPARKTFVKQLAKKANDADLVEMSQFTGAFKEGAFKTNNKGELTVNATKNFTQPEAQRALNDALRRAEDFPVVSNATLKELSDVFEDVLKQTGGKAKGATPQTTALLEEAKKYKSADEFVKAQGTPLYHGTPFGEKVSEIKMGGKGGYFGDGVYLTRRKDVASRFTKLENLNPTLEARGDGNFTNINTGEIVKGGKPAIIETTLPSNIKLKSMTEPEMSKEIEAFRQPNGIIDLDGARNAVRDKYAKQGYDGFEVTATKYFDEPQTVIFPNSVSKIKTRTQLEDIWKQANE